MAGLQSAFVVITRNRLANGTFLSCVGAQGQVSKVWDLTRGLQAPNPQPQGLSSVQVS